MEERGSRVGSKTGREAAGIHTAEEIGEAEKEEYEDRDLEELGSPAGYIVV
jgi:hypothetical protein